MVANARRQKACNRVPDLAVGSILVNVQQRTVEFVHWLGVTWGRTTVIPRKVVELAYQILADVPTSFIRALSATAIRFRVIGEAARVHYSDTTVSRRSKL